MPALTWTEAPAPLPPLQLIDDLAPHRRIIGGSRNIEHHEIFVAIDDGAHGAFEFEAIEKEMQRRRFAVFVDGDINRPLDGDTER